jgi:phosphoglycerate kinase
MMNVMTDIPDLKGKKVLMRVDFDVPVGADGTIQEEYRIIRQKEAIGYLLDHGARVVMMAHITAVPSFEKLVNQLQKILDVQMVLCKDAAAVEAFLGDGGSLALMENLRIHPEEEANDQDFARQIASGYDLYVNNAFAVCHRAHASVVSVPLFLPTYAGPLIVQETQRLQAVIGAPAAGKIIFIGGAKVETKMPVIAHLVDKAEAIAVGGRVTLEMPPTDDPRIHLATDFVTGDGADLDIGPDSAAAFARLCVGARLIVWNGPMGKFEDERFMAGTKAVAQAIAASGAETVIGGGDTIAAVDKLGLLGTMSFVSTGGGAMLAFLAGQQLPGLKALGYYEEK